jgi:hypothetical protein
MYFFLWLDGSALPSRTTKQLQAGFGRFIPIFRADLNKLYPNLDQIAIFYASQEGL